MKQATLFPVLMMVLLMLSLTACSNTDDEESGTDDDDDTTTDDDDDDDTASDDDDDDDTTADDDDDDDLVAGTCTAMEFDMKANDSGQVFLTFADMTAHYEDITEYDIVFAKVHGQGPTGYLGTGVTALNAGNEVPFDDFSEAPEDGYAEDGEEPVIGHSWQNGGSGPEGYDCTGAVYVLTLADGSYAKFTVTRAKDGVVTMEAFHQADGSRTLDCLFDE